MLIQKMSNKIFEMAKNKLFPYQIVQTCVKLSLVFFLAINCVSIIGFLISFYN